MASGWSSRIRTDAQQWITGNGTPTRPSTAFAGLVTTNPLDDGTGNATPGTTEPSTTGSYARQSITWITTVATPANDAPAIVSNNGTISWTSTAAFSTGATVLSWVGIYNSSTLSNINSTFFMGRASITGGGFAVNASGITLSIASAGLTMNMVSA